MASPVATMVMEAGHEPFIAQSTCLVQIVNPKRSSLSRFCSFHPSPTTRFNPSTTIIKSPIDTKSTAAKSMATKFGILPASGLHLFHARPQHLPHVQLLRVLRRRDRRRQPVVYLKEVVLRAPRNGSQLNSDGLVKKYGMSHPKS